MRNARNNYVAMGGNRDPFVGYQVAKARGNEIARYTHIGKTSVYDRGLEFIQLCT